MLVEKVCHLVHDIFNDGLLIARVLGELSRGSQVPGADPSTRMEADPLQPASSSAEGGPISTESEQVSCTNDGGSQASQSPGQTDGTMAKPASNWYSSSSSP